MRRLILFLITWPIGILVNAQQFNGADSLAMSDSVIVPDSSIESITGETEAVKIESEASSNISAEIDFVAYLLSLNLNDEAITHCHQILGSNQLLGAQRDTLLFHLGWLHYFSQTFDSAAFYLAQTSANGPMNRKAALYRSVSLIYLNQYENAREVLSALPPCDSEEETALSHLQLAAIALLMRDYEEFDSLSAGFTGNYFSFSAEEQNLRNYAEQMRHFKRKSPLLAGTLSAIVPGLGKWYVGYRGLPFGAFSLVAPLSAIVAETIIIGGLINPISLAAIAAFSPFYIGNVWGSALSVAAFETEFYEEMDHGIRYDLHIPVRRVYQP